MLQIYEKEKDLLNSKITNQTGNARLVELEGQVKASESNFTELGKRILELKRNIRAQEKKLTKAEELREHWGLEKEMKGYSIQEVALVTVINRQNMRTERLSNKLEKIEKDNKEREIYIERLKNRIREQKEKDEKRANNVRREDTNIDGENEYNSKKLNEIRESHTELKVSVNGEIGKARKQVLNYADRLEDTISKYAEIQKVYIYIYIYNIGE